MKGRTIPLSLPRRIVNDMLHEAGKIPTVPVQRTIRVPELVIQRASMPEPRLSWTTIFAWAMARVSHEMPILRRVYLSHPWARLYEYPMSISMIALEREYHGEPMVFFVKIKNAESMSIFELDDYIRRCKTMDIETLPEFRRVLRIARLPCLARRALWKIGLNWGRQRANYFGTFGITSYAALGAESLHPISPCTVTLTYGIINEQGEIPVRMIYDHRVMDGATVARALVLLEQHLKQAAWANMRLTA